MKVLLLSNDLALLGAKTSTGDTVSRHCAYGQLIERLSIIVLVKKGNFQPLALSPRVSSYPTKASAWAYSYPKNILAVATDLFRGNHYDLIVCQDPFFTGLAGYRLKKKYGSKLLIDFHGDFWANPYWLQENPLRLGLLALSKLTIKKADALRVVSSGIKKKLLRAGFDLPIAVIPTPVNLENFKTPDSQAVLSIRNEFAGQKILLFVGRLTTEKNLPSLLKCFQNVVRHYPRTTLLIAGDGPEKSQLEKLITARQLANNVKLLGQINYQGLLNYFHAADIFVLPSRHESFGKVILEAAAAGKPTVASATTGAKEIIINGQTGWLAPVNNAKRLVEKIILLLSDDNLARQMGANAYQHVWQKYDWDTSVKNVVAYWREIVGQK
ncbi:glycosyltransferase family 4 protein [Candidatus Kuenenbacteria bacterium]|nr:glycosyltransferase family 4 protein [Candidatus Kuenenbacteria bacterium]